LFIFAEYLGLIAFTMSGFLIGSRNQLDLLGVLISTFLTALGGGIVRDVIVHRTPYTFSHDAPAMVVFILFMLLVLLRFYRYASIQASIESRFTFILIDSIGLVAFSVSGALIALEYGLNLTGVLVLSFVTAVGGGIARDVIINEVPLVFKSGFYGTIALIIALFVYILELLEWSNYYTMALLLVMGVTLRVVAYYQRWSIPLPQQK